MSIYNFKAIYLVRFASCTVSYLNQPGYVQGVLWMLAVCLISTLNDTFIRLAGLQLHGFQVAFFRFFFSFITLIPITIYKRSLIFNIHHYNHHIIRVILGYLAITCWIIGIAKTPLIVANTLAQNGPSFVLIMAFFILREKIGWYRVLATLVGMVGIIFAIQSSESSSILSFTNKAFDGTIWIIISVFICAVIDIFNKTIIFQEHPLNILFYFAAGTTIIGIIPAYVVWQTPTVIEVFWAFCLGIGANIIFYCILRALAATEISALQPYRYIELIFAGFFGFIIFDEIPSLFSIVGGVMIVLSTSCIALYETRQNKKIKLALSREVI